ncbi:g10000 [Coccomyxa elongata]
MPAPKKSSPVKGTKSAAAVPTPQKPAWVSDGLWQLAQDTSNLIDRLKKADDSEIESGCSHAQVAQLLWDQSLASPDKQEELVKLGFIEVAAKHLTGSITTAAPLTGVLSTLATSSVAARDAILAYRPSILPLFTAALPSTSASSAAAIVGALKSLAMHEDSHGRLLKGLSNWDLKGLPELIATTDSGMTQVSRDAGLLLDALLCAPAPPAAQPLAQQKGKAKPGSPAPAKPMPQAGKRTGKGKTGGTDKAADGAASAQLQESALKSEAIMATLLQVCSSTVQLEAADRIVALKVVQALLSADHRRAASHFLKGAGLSAVVAVLSDASMSLPCKCLAAAVLKDLLIPQQRATPAVNQDTLVMAGSKGRLPVETAGDSTKHQASQLQSVSPEVASLDAALDEAMARIEQALHAGVLPPLLSLCKPPEGHIFAAHTASQGEGAIRPKSAAKKAGGGMKGLEGAEAAAAAQANACSCLKMMSLHDGCKQGIVDSGGTSILLPLLASKVDHVLLNVAMLPDLAEELEREGAPIYVHGMNLVRLRRSQPGRQGSAAATKLLVQLTSQLTVPFMPPLVEPA